MRKMQNERPWAIKNTYTNEFWTEYPKGNGEVPPVMLFKTKKEAQDYAVRGRRKIPCDANESKVVEYAAE